MPVAKRRDPAWVAIALAAVVAIALWLRLDGIDRLLPYYPEPDDHVSVQVHLIESGVPVAERPGIYSRYPLLMASLSRVLPRAAVPAGAKIEEHLRAASTVSHRVRLVSAIFSTLAVVLTFALARRFMGPLPALLASTLLALDFIHILFSQEARPHGLHATLALCAVLCALRLRENPSWSAYLFAGVAAALSVASLQTGVFTILPLLAAHLLQERGTRRLPWVKLSVPAAAIALAAWIAYPTGTLPENDRSTVELDVSAQGIRTGGSSFNFSKVDGSGFVRMAHHLWEHDPVLVLICVFGAVWALRGLAQRLRDRNVLVVLAYVVPYLFVWGLYSIVFERYLMPSLPFLACLAAWGAKPALEREVDRTSIHALRPYVPACVLLLVLAFPIWSVWHYVRVRAAPDTVELAAQWIGENVKPEDGPILVTPQLQLPLWYDRSTFENDAGPKLAGGVTLKLASQWVEYQSKLRASPARAPLYELVNIPATVAGKSLEEDAEAPRRYLDGLKPAWALIEVSNWNKQIPMVRAIYDLVRERGELAYTDPRGSPEKPMLRTLAYQDVPGFIGRVLALDRLGPRIEIYRMR